MDFGSHNEGPCLICRDFSPTSFSALSLTVQTQCQCCPWLCKHSVSDVLDCADTVSVLSLTLQTQCQCCHWLRVHFVSVVLDCVDTGSVLLSLTMQKQCQCCHWLCRHSVSVVLDCADTGSVLLSLTMQTQCWLSQWLNGPGQDYLNTFGKPSRHLTDFKGIKMVENLVALSL